MKNITISSFENVIIKKVKIISKINKHGKASFSALIPDNLVDECNKNLMSDDYITISHNQKNVFVGIITGFCTYNENASYVVDVVLETATVRLDLDKHKRSFQNPALTYKDLILKVQENYADVSFIYNTDNDTTEKLIMQYEETDWEFLVRLASMKNECLVVKQTMEGSNFYFGTKEKNSGFKIKVLKVSEKRLSQQRKKNKENGLSFLDSYDEISYTIDSLDFYELGATIEYEDNSYIIGDVLSETMGSEFIHKYTLFTENSVKQNRIYNQTLIGLSMFGKVNSIEKDTVTLVLEEDENQADAGFLSFAYATPYSSDDGSGWYAMPEKNDGVRLFFPDYKEESAFVMNSSHLKSKNPKERTNPDFKSIMNKDGKQILFKPDSLIITNNKGLSIELSDENGIIISSNKDIMFKSSEQINISSINSTLNLVASEQLVFQQGETVLELKDNLTLSGAEVHLD